MGDYHRDMLRQALREYGPELLPAWVAGYKAAVRAYAVWDDGEQLVGVMREPLHDVLTALDRHAAELTTGVAS